VSEKPFLPVRVRVQLTHYEAGRYVPLRGYGMRFTVADLKELPDLWRAIEATVQAEMEKKKAAAAPPETTGG